MGRNSYLGGSGLMRAWGGGGGVPIIERPKVKTKKPIDNAENKEPKVKRKARRKRKASLQPANTGIVTVNLKKGAKKPLGNGLTIPEMISRAEYKVKEKESLIIRQRDLLGKLERELEEARRELKAARNVPRRS